MEKTISQLSGAADDKDADKIDSTTTQALNGTPVYYASNLHAGKEFYLNSLQENYQLSFSDDFADVMEQIETEYKAANQLTDVSDSEGGVTTSADTFLYATGRIYLPYMSMRRALMVPLLLRWILPVRMIWQLFLPE